MMSRCCVTFCFPAFVFIPLIAFLLPKMWVPRDAPPTRLLPPGRQEMRIPELLARANEELRAVEALLLSLQEPLRLPEMELLARDLDKTESETIDITQQTVKIALVECFAAAHRAEEAKIFDPKVYQSLDPVFRSLESLAKQSLRRLKGTVKVKLKHVIRIIKDEDTSVLEEIHTIEQGLDWPWAILQNWKHGFAFYEDQRPRLAGLHRRHEGMRQALEGLQRVRGRVEDGAIRDLERYLKRIRATRDVVGGDAGFNRSGLRKLCTQVERAMNGYY